MGRKNFLYAVFIVVLLQACSATKKVNIVEPSTPPPTVSQKKVHEITFGEIKKAGKLWGLDLSHYQEIVDWDMLVEQGPDFIFLKATEGVTLQDEKYLEHYNQLRKLKIPVGSYHFFTYKTTGKDQAKNFLATAKYKQGDLPLVLDAEYAKTMPPPATVVKELMAFMKAVNTKYGTSPIIYCNFKYYLTYLKGNIPAKCKLWIVDYRGKPDCVWTFWQTTDRFNVGGVKGKVDFNLYNGTFEDFKRLLR
jgi:lysozyme